MGTAQVAHLSHNLGQQKCVFTLDKTTTGGTIATHEPLLWSDCGSLNEIIYSESRRATEGENEPNKERSVRTNEWVSDSFNNLTCLLFG